DVLLDALRALCYALCRRRGAHELDDGVDILQRVAHGRAVPEVSRHRPNVETAECGPESARHSGHLVAVERKASDEMASDEAVRAKYADHPYRLHVDLSPDAPKRHLARFGGRGCRSVREFATQGLAIDASTRAYRRSGADCP